MKINKAQKKFLKQYNKHIANVIRADKQLDQIEDMESESWDKALSANVEASTGLEDFISDWLAEVTKPNLYISSVKELESLKKFFYDVVVNNDPLERHDIEMDWSIDFDSYFREAYFELTTP